MVLRTEGKKGLSASPTASSILLQFFYFAYTEMSGEEVKAQAFPLFKLPDEIRYLIYHFALTNTSPIRLHLSTDSGVFERDSINRSVSLNVGIPKASMC
jgi:hypothetical protein